MRYGRPVNGSMRAWRIRALACVCASALVFTLAATAQARPVLVRGVGTRWTPSAVSVARGATVKWRGVSGFHDVVAYGGNWSFHEALPAGSAVKRRFRVSGTFRFRCTFHSALVGSTCTGMCGTVRVAA
jgi:plastocyanin